MAAPDRPELRSVDATLQFDPAVTPGRPNGQPATAAMTANAIVVSAPALATTVLTADEVESLESASNGGSREGRPSTSTSTVLLSGEELARFLPTRATPEIAGSRTSVLPPAQLPARARTAESAPPVALAGGVSTAPTAPRERGLILAVATAATALAVGLVAFAVPHLLLAKSRSWIAPTVLSKSDARVLDVAAALERETAQKSALALRKKQIVARLREIDSAASLEASFRTSFEAALRSDVAGCRAEVLRLQKLVADQDATNASRDDADRKSEESKLSAARQRLRMLEAALPGGHPASAYGALALRREYDLSRVETEKAIAEKDALTKAVAEVEEAIASNEALLATIESSPYRTAIGRDATLAFVPYDNTPNVEVGAPLTACRTGTLFCTRVGTVAEMLTGEVHGTSPVTGKEGRGRLVRITLTNADAAARPLLFVGRAP